MPQPVGRDDVQRMQTAGAQVVEVLPRSEYEEQHIAGALHIALTQLDAASTAQLDRNKPVIVYCNDLQ